MNPSFALVLCHLVGSNYRKWFGNIPGITILCCLSLKLVHLAFIYLLLCVTNVLSSTGPLWLSSGTVLWKMLLPLVAFDLALGIASSKFLPNITDHMLIFLRGPFTHVPAGGVEVGLWR